MNDLIEDYQRKINSVNELLKNKDNDEETINRLKIKVGCYRSFLTDLKRALNIDPVMSTLRVCATGCNGIVVRGVCNNCKADWR